MNNQVKTQDQYIADLKTAYNYHINQADFFKKLLDMAEDLVHVKNKISHTDVLLDTEYDDKPHRIYVPPPKKQSFEETIRTILYQNNRPMSVPELIKEYKNIKGYVSEAKNFSSQLRTASSKNNQFDSIVIESFPRNLRFWWGLKEWFINDNEFEAEYMNKIYNYNKLF